VALGNRGFVIVPLVHPPEPDPDLPPPPGPPPTHVAAAVALIEEGWAAACAAAGTPDHALRLGVVHGQMKVAERDAVMSRFRSGEVDVLVGTTVLEVGVDVPDATVMIILDADRFGIAQLHQLRGRVGRGAHESQCWLVTTPKDVDAPISPRVEALVASTDGFELAEVDLDLRGGGQLLGTRQSGLTDLKFAQLRRDRPLLERAREFADELVDVQGPLHDEVVRLFADADLSAG